MKGELKDEQYKQIKQVKKRLGYVLLYFGLFFRGGVKNGVIFSQYMNVLLLMYGHDQKEMEIDKSLLLGRITLYSITEWSLFDTEQFVNLHVKLLGNSYFTAKIAL